MKIRRTGKHTAPSPVAATLVRVAPVAAVAGAAAISTTGPQPALADTAHPVSDTGSFRAIEDTGPIKVIPAKVTSVVKSVSVTAKHARPETYTVKAGDTLSGIASHDYGNASDWPKLWNANHGEISDPNLIYVGETLKIPGTFAVDAVAYAPRHAAPAARKAAGGTLGCSGLESLWEAAGGAAGEAHMAAEIAEAESSGEQYATDNDGNGTTDRGYWQINSTWGARSTYTPMGNARAAVAISGNGSNWSPWTTYGSGAYSGRC